MKTHIRILEVATSSVREAIARLRYDVYVEERGFSMSGADHACRLLLDESDQHSVVFGAFDGDEAIGTVRVTPMTSIPADDPSRQLYGVSSLELPETSMAVVGRLMVRPSHRGSSACLQLITAAYARARRDGQEVGLMDCTARQLPIDEMLGCRRYKDVVGDPVYGMNIPLLNILGDVRHLERIRSPLLYAAREFPADPALSDWYEKSFPDYNRACSIRLMAREEWEPRVLGGDRQSAHSLFDGTPALGLQRLLKASTLIDIESDNTILPRGNRGTEMYLIVDGAVEMAIDHPTQGQRLTGLGRGQLVGESGFLWGSRAPACWEARTLTRCTLLSLSAGHFHRLSAVDPQLTGRVLFNLSKDLCRRLYVNTRGVGAAPSFARHADDPRIDRCPKPSCL